LVNAVPGAKIGENPRRVCQTAAALQKINNLHIFLISLHKI
jgi:hypothetical protein